MISINSTELTGDIRRITGKLGKLGDLIDDTVPTFVNPVIVGLMRIYDPQKDVTRAVAYPAAPAGPGWFSDKQRRWFFRAWRTGQISVPYRRTYAMRRGWHIVGKGKNSAVVNETQAAKFAMGKDTQSNHERLVGWSTTEYRLKNPGKTILKAAQQGVRDAIKKAGLS